MILPFRWLPRVVALVALGLVASCGPQKKAPDRLTMAPASFDQLPGWSNDTLGPALDAFRQSCGAFAKLSDTTAIGPDALAGTAVDWREPCAAAAALDRSDETAVRRFFESAFTPFRLGNNDEGQGLFTGYYEAELRGSRIREAKFTTPLLKRPTDLVMVELGLFRPAWRGERIAGRVEGGQLKPYASRAEIEHGRLDHRNLELLWVDDPIDAFFLQIQGSGRILLPDGTTVRVGYDGQNGQPYVPIGRLLVERGALTRDEVSMQSIRAWLVAHPGDAADLMDQNPSYVFFREMPGDGPIGAEGVVLMPGRSLAIDQAFLPLGVPLWLDAEDTPSPGGHLRRLV
ncbi:MAG: MltA domain-containing protein, partial [Alphaproteobacteria bacterium]|nr:MltA domain-containing protein [Alphaproteobacteria bacterium]